ncbi:hypothetical protein D9758_007487 [Tetrapyrgos nigripes]|uniref:F-box domain-containing protein n=1 Tax=Tetrapyrgos nigripes TaxID=182062 RepID=A0A8H5G3S4_9AGAR|nr:hypothetical protein D9758_007487 [Tetrapyrgos nigripes]
MEENLSPHNMSNMPAGNCSYVVEIDIIDQKIQRIAKEARKGQDSSVDSTDPQVEKHVELDELTKLKTRRNELVPISRLPEELLSKFFKLCVRPKKNYYAPMFHRWSWTKVSHICKHWRNVALGCPALWGCLDLTTPTWIPEMLRRSQMAPLVINMPQLLILKPKSADAIKTLEKALGELEMLQAAPLLHTLQLSAKETGDWFAESECIVVLPLDFLGGHTPSLRHVDLQDFHIPWDSSVFRNLTSLKIIHKSTDHAPSLQQLTEILSRMPASLETLELERVLSLANSTTTIKVVQLPRLRSIRLDGDVVSCANLLERISFPSTTTMEFDCVVRYEADALEKASPMLATLSRLRGRMSQAFPSESSLSAMSDLYISCHNPFHVQLPGENGASASWHSGSYWLDFRMLYDTSRNDNLNLRIIEVISPLTHVRVLSLDNPSSTLVNALNQPMVSLDCVHTLHLHGSYLSDIFEELKAFIETEQRFALFPSLKSFSLSEVEFFDYSTETYEDLYLLKDMLVLRSEKAPIESLQLKMCKSLSRKHIRLLREVCQNVEWDREVGVEEESNYADEDESVGKRLSGDEESEDGSSEEMASDEDSMLEFSAIQEAEREYYINRGIPTALLFG